MTSPVSTKKLRRATAAFGAALAVMIASEGAASATQSDVLYVGQTKDYATWFFGRTQVCLTNTGSSGEGKFQWWSGTSTGNVEGIRPGSTYCMTKSFAGIRIGMHNWGYSPLKVTFPIGP